MLGQILDFFGEKARGFILTCATAITGKVSGELEGLFDGSYYVEDLQELQKWVFIASLVVAILTTISYLYKFYQWIKKNKISILKCLRLKK